MQNDNKSFELRAFVGTRLAFKAFENKQTGKVNDGRHCDYNEKVLDAYYCFEWSFEMLFHVTQSIIRYTRRLIFLIFIAFVSVENCVRVCTNAGKSEKKYVRVCK